MYRGSMLEIANFGRIDMRRIWSTVLVAGVCLLTSACTALDPVLVSSPASVRDQAPERIGYLEHRGKRYSATELMDASSREKSDDPFISGFSPDETYAIEWAGLDYPKSNLD